jgi:hypothetical protein
MRLAAKRLNAARGEMVLASLDSSSVALGASLASRFGVLNDLKRNDFR